MIDLSNWIVGFCVTSLSAMGLYIVKLHLTNSKLSKDHVNTIKEITSKHADDQKILISTIVKASIESTQAIENNSRVLERVINKLDRR